MREDPIVGHSTSRDEHGMLTHAPIRQSEAEKLLRDIDRAKQLRADRMPAEREAIDGLFEAWLRLKELGWSEAQYCPKDGSEFEVIEAGSTGVHRCVYWGAWPNGTYMVSDGDDLWPSRPILFRRKPEAPR